MEIRTIESLINSSKFNVQNAYLQLYLVIKCCGTVESLAKTLIFDKVTHSCNPRVEYYLDKKILKSSTNPSYKNIVDLLTNFDKINWAKPFKDRFAGTQIASKLDSLVNIRNSVAHGDTVTPPSTQVITDYLRSSCFILDYLDRLI